MKGNTGKTFLIGGLVLASVLLFFLAMAGVNAVNATNSSAPQEPEPTLEAPTTPIQGVPLPVGAITTPDGGFVTPIRSMDDKGNRLDIVYDDKGTTFDSPLDRAPACAKSTTAGIYQEGGNWNINSQNQIMGYSENWKMPTGTYTGALNFVYYNPVNFKYPFAPQGKYDFFQVDFGLGPGAGPQSNWFLTTAILNKTPPTYTLTTLPSVTVSPGSTYRVDASLQPYPLANPPSYVVQITLGSNSWIRSIPLGYAPNMGSFYINSFQSYQDEYIKQAGSTTVSADSNSSPRAIKNVGGTIVFDSTLITGKTLWDNFNPNASSSKSWDVLSPVSSGTKSFTDPKDCSSWS